MKKTFILFMALAMALSMTACGEDNNKSEPISYPSFMESLSPIESEYHNSDINESTSEKDEPISEEYEPVSKMPTPEVSGGQTSNIFVVSDGESTKESTIQIDFKKPADVAINFVKALATGEYDVAVSALNTENSPFVFAEDIGFCLPRSGYSKITEIAGSEVYLLIPKDGVDKSTTSASVDVELLDAQNEEIDTYTIHLHLSDDNRWLVSDSSFYVTDYYVGTPGNVALSINGIPADEYCVDNYGSYNLKERYCIPVIGKAKKEFSISCDRFTETIEEMPTTNDKEKPLNIVRLLKDDELTEALDAVKNIWNSMHDDYMGGASLTDMLKYFDKGVDTEVVKACCDGFNALESSGFASSEYNDFYISQVLPQEEAKCFYITDDVIVINMQYQLNWTKVRYEKSEALHSTRESHIFIKNTGEGYKIFIVSDQELFSSFE